METPDSKRNPETGLVMGRQFSFDQEDKPYGTPSSAATRNFSLGDMMGATAGMSTRSFMTQDSSRYGSEMTTSNATGRQALRFEQEEDKNGEEDFFGALLKGLEGSEDDLDLDDQDGSDQEGDDELSHALTYWKQQLKVMQTGDPETIENESRFMVSLDEDQSRLMLQQNAGNKKIRQWAHFDLLFGIFIVANSVLFGLTTDGVVDENSAVAQGIEIGFLVVFILEFFLRYRKSKMSIMLYLADRWSLFDCFVILTSVIDVCILGPMESSNAALAQMSLLRVLRLCRLVRLVRVLRMVKGLWILLTSMGSSVQVVLWALLVVFIVSCVNGLILYEVLGCQTSQDPALIDNVCGPFFWVALLTHFRIATHDGANILRKLHDSQGSWILLVFYCYLAVVSIGVLNLVVGVMLTSTIRINRGEKTVEDGAHEVMMLSICKTLRDRLVEECIANNGRADESCLTLEMVLAFGSEKQRKRSVTPQDSDDAMEAANSDQGTHVRSMASVMRQEDGRIHRTGSQKVAQGGVNESLDAALQRHKEIRKLLTDMGIQKQELQTIFRTSEIICGSDAMTIDDFVDGVLWLRGVVQPLDVTHLVVVLEGMYKRIAKLEKYAGEAMHALTETSAEMAPHVLRDEEAADGTGAVEEAAQSPQEEHQGVDVLQAKVIAEERYIMIQEKGVEARQRALLRFDSVFLSIVLFNAAWLGIKSMFPAGKNTCDMADVGEMTLPFTVCVMDYSFLFVYTVEIFLRLLLHHQLEVLHDTRLKFAMPAILFEMDSEKFFGMFSAFKSLSAKDGFFLFELMILILSLLDMLLFRFLDVFADNFTVLQLFRLVRIMKLLRLALRSSSVGIIMRTVYENRRLLLWAVLLMLGLIYFFALIIHALLPEAIKNDPVNATRWGGILSSMLTLGQIATLSNWYAQLESVSDYPQLMVPMVLFLAATSFGILNLISGVMVQASFRASISEGERFSASRLLVLRDALKSALDRTFVKTRAQYEKARQTANDFLEEQFKKPQEEAEEEDKEQIREHEPPVDVSWESRNGDSVCTIRTPVWVSSRQVAFEFDLNIKTHCILENASLEWEGGLANPSLIFVDQEMYRNPKKGKLVFNGVPALRSIGFRFAKGYTLVQISPTVLNVTNQDTAKCLNIDPVDISKLTVRDFNLLMKDHALISKLHQNGLRADQALMVFQKLDVKGEGQVSTAYFIEGLLRMKMPVKGLDIAVAKSMMRCSVNEAADLLRGAVQCHQCFSEIIRKLRGVNVCPSLSASQMQHAAKAASTKPHRKSEGDHKVTLLRQKNERLRKKISNLKRHLAKEREALSQLGDSRFGPQTANDKEETMSLDSAGEGGWD
eukprot:TRINITY_DN86_c0_g2_i1.p1 TRINITY_DN86_c0_g2~~TRINITY_DN86_c0_g2_i1.p1  ORF type:complete len:1344 (+),score=284.28 TRINITY_DN86_c0_g2_i1:154-4185(+)